MSDVAGAIQDALVDAKLLRFDTDSLSNTSWGYSSMFIFKVVRAWVNPQYCSQCSTFLDTCFASYSVVDCQACPKYQGTLELFTALVLTKKFELYLVQLFCFMWQSGLPSLPEVSQGNFCPGVDKEIRALPRSTIGPTQSSFPSEEYQQHCLHGT